MHNDSTFYRLPALPRPAQPGQQDLCGPKYDSEYRRPRPAVSPGSSLTHPRAPALAGADYFSPKHGIVIPMITPVTSSGSRSGLATGTSLHTRHLATARSTDGAPPSPLSGHLLRSASPDSELSDPETLSDGSDVDGGWSDVSATTDPTLMESLRQSLPTVPLLPYRNQVGGHSPILRFSDKAICKPLVEKERRFYESVDAIQPSLSHFLPSYLGIVNVTFGANRPRSPCDRFRLRTGDSAETDPKPVIVFEQNIHLLPSWLAEHVPRHSPNHLPFPETKLNKAWRAQQEQVLQEAFSPQALSTLCRRQRRARATPHHRRRHSLTDMSGGHMSKRVLPQHVTDSHPYSGSHPLSSSAVSANELTSPHGSDESLPGSPTRGHTLPDDLAATVGPSLAPAPATSVGIDLSHRFRQLTTDNVPAAQPLPIRSASARHRPTTSPQLIHHENRRLFVAPGFDRKALALPFQQSPAERTSPLTASPPPLPGTTGLSPALRFHRQPLTAIAELPSPHHPHGDQEDPFVMEDAPTLTPGLSPPGTPPKCRPLHHLALPDSLATPGPPTVQQDWAAGLTRRFMASKADSSGVTPDVHQFILLEDLTNGLRRPCILDLKMGTRQHGVDAPERKRVNKTKKCARTTSKSLGVRMCGMQVYKASKSRYLFQDKYYGRSLSDKTFARSLLEFLDNGETIAVHHIPRLLRRLYELYRLVITIHGFRFYASSLLIVYDGIVSPAPANHHHHHHSHRSSKTAGQGTSNHSSGSGPADHSPSGAYPYMPPPSTLDVRIIDFTHCTFLTDPTVSATPTLDRPAVCDHPLNKEQERLAPYSDIRSDCSFCPYRPGCPGPDYGYLYGMRTLMREFLDIWRRYADAQIKQYYEADLARLKSDLIRNNIRL